MNEIVVRRVSSRRDRQIFLTFPWRIFQDDPLWVPPLLPDWSSRIDPKRGVFFRRGDADFYIAWRNGSPVGTVCAAEDRDLNRQSGGSECIFGFFNYIEDYAVMQALLAQVCQWARARGLNYLTGPWNLDYEDSYGVLIEGRDRPPAMLCGHTPPYYQDFMVRYGFHTFRGDNIAFELDITGEAAPLQQLRQMAERVRARGRFTIRPGDMKHWEQELDHIWGLLNRALAHLPDLRPWPREVVFDSLAPFRKIADPELILFAQEGDRIVGWLPGLPNLNEALIHVDGLRHPWDYLKLWWYMRRPFQCLTVKSVLVLPEYWGSGVAILLFDELLRRAQARGYRWIDGSLTSEDNPRTPALGERFGARIYKRYRVYRYDL